MSDVSTWLDLEHGRGPVGSKEERSWWTWLNDEMADLAAACAATLPKRFNPFVRWCELFVFGSRAKKIAQDAHWSFLKLTGSVLKELRPILKELGSFKPGESGSSFVCAELNLTLFRKDRRLVSGGWARYQSLVSLEQKSAKSDVRERHCAEVMRLVG